MRGNACVVGCHGYIKPLKGGSLPVTSLQLKNKGENFFIFFYFLVLLPFYCHSFHGMMGIDPAMERCIINK